MQSAALGTQVGNLTMGLETDARAFTAGENTESTINLVMQCTHSIQFADVGMLQMNKAETKRYVEENITIMSMIISSSHSYIYHIFSSSTQ